MIHLLLVSALAALLLTAPAFAADRIDFFDAQGRRTGYAIVDSTGRVDIYDASSRRTGWGQIDQTGRVERFDVNGKRQGEGVLPPQTPGRQ